MGSTVEPKTPREAFTRFFETATAGDLLWLIITIGCGVFLYWLAMEQRKQEIVDKGAVFKWLVIFTGSSALIYFLAWFRISQGGSNPQLYFGISVIASILLIFYAERKLTKLEIIVLGTMQIITGFIFLVFFALGDAPASWAIGFGILEGTSFAMLILVFRRYMKSGTDTSDPYDEDSEFKVK